MRPTESAIIYVQQIGRGLRKDDSKDYVTIIDIIGNYKKSYNNIIALSQDRSGSKDQLKYFLKYGTDLLFGESTISFDKITEERIYNVISNTNFSTMDKVKTDYLNLKAQLGRTPYLTDFYEKQLISPVQILREKGKYRTYYDILHKFEEGYVLKEEEHQFIRYLSRFMSPAKRIHEWECLMFLLRNGSSTVSQLNHYIEEKYNFTDQLENTSNAVSHLTREIFKSLSDLKKFPIIASFDAGKISLNSDFINIYFNNELFKNLVDDLYNFNKKYYSDFYIQEKTEGLKLFGLYNKLEAHKYSNYDYNNGFQVSGYNFNPTNTEAIAFITLDNSSSFTLYDNKIVNQKQVVWFTRNRRILFRDNELTKVGKIANGIIPMKIFIKKQSGEDFYYLDCQHFSRQILCE